MVAFGVIGFLIFVLIFLVTRQQGVQRELKQLQAAHKTIQTQNKYSLNILMTVSTQLQHAYQTKLASMQSHGLIKHSDYELVSFILENLQYVVVQCCQHNETVEIAIRKALKGHDLTLEQISQYIARQPSEIRVPWCKNTVDGFIAACRNIVTERSSSKNKPEAKEENPA